MNELDQWLENLLTDDVVRLLVSAVFKGFQDTENLYRNVSFLGTETAKDPKPYIRRVAIDYQLLLLEKRNRLFKCDPVPNVVKNCKHVEVRIKNPLKDLIITQNGLNDPTEHPRKAVFRDYLENNAQYSFKLDIDSNVLLVPTREELIRQFPQREYIYAQLCYGGKDFPEFIFLGILDGINYGWSRRIELPTNMVIETPVIDIQPENEPTLRPQEKTESDDNDDNDR